MCYRSSINLGEGNLLYITQGLIGYLSLVSQHKEFHNTFARALNKYLRLLCPKFHSDMKNTMIIYGDMYEIKLDPITKCKKYGNLTYISTFKVINELFIATNCVL